MGSTAGLIGSVLDEEGHGGGIGRLRGVRYCKALRRRPLPPVSPVSASAVTPMAHAAQATADEIAVRMAMHIHASFSEGIGSMQAHLAEAERIGVDVIWWTEHDHRMVARGHLTDVHFTGLSEYAGGVSLTWQSTYAGQLASSSVTFGKPGSDNDPGDSAMHMTALSSGGPGGTRTMTASPRNYALTTSLDGTTIELDVRPDDVGEDAWFDIVLDTSLPTGNRWASGRSVPAALPGRWRTSGRHDHRYRSARGTHRGRRAREELDDAEPRSGGWHVPDLARHRLPRRCPDRVLVRSDLA